MTSRSPEKSAASQLTWHVIDAKDQVLGRVANQVARLLLGKRLPTARPHLVNPVRVVVINTDQVVLTGRKLEQKMYRRYSGYPGGLKERSAGQQLARDSRRLIELAVAGMLPKNKLRAVRLRQLKLYRTAEHPHQAQLASSLNRQTND